MVMAHGLSGTRRDGLGPFAERFAAAGIAALVFDHRGFGDSGGEPDLFEPPGSSRTGGRRSPAPARCRASTPSGSPPSAPRWAAATRSRRRRTTRGSRPPISQVPFLDMSRQAHRSSPLVTRPDAARRRARPAPAGGRPAATRRPSSTRPAASPAGATSSRSARTRAGATGSPRAGCSAAPTVPARHAAKLHCPWLLCVGEADRVARPGPAIAAARRAPLGELRTYPGVDHFDIYDGPEYEAVVADEVDFLSDTSCAGRPAADSRAQPAARGTSAVAVLPRCWWSGSRRRRR